MHPLVYETSTLPLSYLGDVKKENKCILNKCSKRGSSQRAEIQITIKRPIWDNLITYQLSLKLFFPTYIVFDNVADNVTRILLKKDGNQIRIVTGIPLTLLRTNVNEFLQQPTVTAAVANSAANNFCVHMV